MLGGTGGEDLATDPDNEMANRSGDTAARAGM